LAVLLVAVVLVLLANVKSHRDLEAARASEAQLEARISETQARIDQLAERRNLLLEDPATLERLAREELTMARPGEVVLRLPPSADDR
jgi:cell division protein FtsB